MGCQYTRPTQYVTMNAAFNHTRYYARKKFFKIFGGEVRIYDETKNNLLFFVKQKAFRIKEDVRVYSDTSKDHEILSINTKSIFDIAGTYDITETETGNRIGAVRRKALASIARDTWLILDTDGNEVATVQEDSLLKALLRRIWLGSLLPQSFTITAANGSVVGNLKQTFNPFVPQFWVDFSQDTSGLLDRRLGIAITVMLQIIEGKQQS